MNWIDDKIVNFSDIQELLKKSSDINHFTNDGPCIKELEKYLKELMEIRDEISLICVSNATNGLHVLASAIRLYHKENNNLDDHIRFATQAFTFPASCIGCLSDNQIVDINEIQGIDVNLLDDNVKGLIITNLFGCCTDIDYYVNYCERNNLYLIFDNATCPMTYYKGKNINNFGDGSVVSLHHTKPLGFGEGGIIVCKRKYENLVRRLINFGYDKDKGDYQYLSDGSNSKMSDVSASFILSHIKNNIERITKFNEELYPKIKDRFVIKNFADKQILSCVPVSNVEMRNPCRKYYHPLSQECPIAWELYNKIICVPIHLIDRFL